MSVRLISKFFSSTFQNIHRLPNCYQFLNIKFGSVRNVGALWGA